MGRTQNGCASTGSSEELSYSKLEYILVKMCWCKQGLQCKGSRVLELSWIFKNIVKYNYQNPLEFCFLVQVKAFVIQTSVGYSNLSMKGKRNGFWSSWGAFLWDDRDQDQWSEITRIMLDQTNRRIHSGQGFIGSLDLQTFDLSEADG